MQKVKHEKNDIDLLVDFEKAIDLFDFVHLADEMERILNTRVDLVTPDALKPYIRPNLQL
ncbi:MAG: nucleotidyltransferase domain-containing protein [Acidobacteriota bacterium]